MKNKILTEASKKALVLEYGEDAIKIEKELTELATLIVKRKDTIISLNRTDRKDKKLMNNYIEIDLKIKEIIADINKKLNK